MRETERKKRKIHEDEDEDAPVVRLIATLSLVNVASPRLIAAELLVNGDRSPVNVPMARLMWLRHG